MPCYSPLKGWLSNSVNPSGKRSVVFSPRDGIPYRQLEVACGQCIGCRMRRASDWELRVMHEASLYQENCFVTLTYGRDLLPANASLEHRDFQLFLKRVRAHF